MTGVASGAEPASLADPREWLPHATPPKRGHPERDVQRSVIRFLRLALPPGSIVAAINTERRGMGRTAEQRARFGAALKASGMLPGFFDAVALLPSGRAVWFEFKAPKGRLSPTQRDMHDRTRALGHTVIVCDSIETAEAALLAAGVPTRRTSRCPTP
ncbi:hypothetical protein GCM10010964_43420 [Caldovatus sediminis]|uniref:VRR-NUC domain-containing protein n=1 Tax=Caldovatus sediminis TaxID=2041189 RepID=A0A8J3EF72_9PROT|nr:VRR-NUC domain-containing protein [Caldovatus sediminis]GGG51527.1 hypothetical protein GCM10010964_43420 [Caldovatus sediminis]